MLDETVVTLSCDIATPRDFSLFSTLSYLSRAPGIVFETVSAEHFRKAVYLQDSDRAAILSVSETPNQQGLRVELHGMSLSHLDLAKVRERIVECFYVFSPPDGLLDLFSRDEAVGLLHERYGLVRPFLYYEPYESLLWAIAAQQVNVGFARTLLLRLHEVSGGATLQFEGKDYLLTPRPGDVASLSIDVLREAQFSGTKARGLVEISKALVSKQLDFAVLKKLDYDAAMASLTRYYGVGRWTAEYVLLRGLGFEDVFPSGDLGLKKAVASLYALGSPLVEENIRNISYGWSPYRGWISQLLFYHINVDA